MVGRIDPNKTAHFVAGSPIKEPVGLAFAADGALYIADREGNSTWLRSPDGTLSVFAGSGQEDFKGDNGPAKAAALARPRAVALDGAGNLLIADTGNNRIRQVERVSNVITTVAGSSDVYGFGGDGRPAKDSKLSLPWGVAAGRDGNFYIADTGNNRVRRVTPGGIITTVVGGHSTLKGPAGLAISDLGDVYIATLGDSHLYVVRALAAK
jgi:sugar lactone lactonase YvrE